METHIECLKLTQRPVQSEAATMRTIDTCVHDRLEIGTKAEKRDASPRKSSAQIHKEIFRPSPRHTFCARAARRGRLRGPISTLAPSVPLVDQPTGSVGADGRDNEDGVVAVASVFAVDQPFGSKALLARPVCCARGDALGNSG